MLPESWSFWTLRLVRLYSWAGQLEGRQPVNLLAYSCMAHSWIRREQVAAAALKRLQAGDFRQAGAHCVVWRCAGQRRSHPGLWATGSYDCGQVTDEALTGQRQNPDHDQLNLVAVLGHPTANPSTWHQQLLEQPLAA